MKPKSSLHFIKEISLASALNAHQQDIIKTSIIIFLSEIFLKSIKEEEENPALFDFLKETIEILNIKEQGLGIYHLAVLIHLSDKLGFCISEKVKTNGLEEEVGPVTNEAKEFLIQFSEIPLGEDWNIQIPKQLKKELLQVLINYFETHLMKKGDIKSHLVLEMVL